jgi:hypothetical protein
MNQPEEDLARRIVQQLDHGLERIEPATRGRLHAARTAALAAYRERPAPVAGLVWAGAAVRFVQDSDLRQLVALGALVLALAGFAYWQSAVPSNELVDIDAALLTSELPVNAYLDSGFDSWLKRSLR